MPHPLIWVTAALLGAAIGSFLNVCVHRWPRDESIVSPRSRCPACGSALAWYENVPVLSWLVLRGRCRTCRHPISLQYPAIELATALIWVALAVRYGVSVEALRGAVFLTILLGIAVSDARHYIIPDEFSLGGLGIGIGLAAFPGTIPFVPALTGAALGFASLWIVAVVGSWLFRKPAMGGGDIKMMAMIGAFLGPAGVLLTIFLGALLGSVVFGPISWRTGKLVPFGVFLALGAAVTYVWGDAILGWYLGVAFGTV